MTSVDEFDPQALVTKAPSSPNSGKRPEIGRPSHISIEDDGNTLYIHFRWISRGFVNVVMKCLLCNSFLVGFCWLALTSDDRFFMWLAIIFCMPHVAIGLFLKYVTLTVLLNRTVIKVTSEFVTVRHGPLPWWGNRELAIDALQRLYCYKHTRKDSVSASYSVTTLTKAATKVDLLTGIENVAEALLIKQELERWLKIKTLT